ncbi:MAG: hypothetical protein ABI587_11360 [Gemmatimonadales bacterium]
MARRAIDVAGSSWEVSSTGRVTQYARDEFGITFRRIGGTTPEVRVARFAPLTTRRSEDALARLTDRQLHELWQRSQPSWTAPDLGYQR